MKHCSAIKKEWTNDTCNDLIVSQGLCVQWKMSQKLQIYNSVIEHPWNDNAIEMKDKLVVSREQGKE